MKDLRSKEHYCYKIYTLLMKSSAHPPYIENPLDVLPPSSIFKRKSCPTLLWFFKNLSPPLNKGGGFTLYRVWQRFTFLAVMVTFWQSFSVVTNGVTTINDLLPAANSSAGAKFFFNFNLRSMLSYKKYLIFKYVFFVELWLLHSTGIQWDQETMLQDINW